MNQTEGYLQESTPKQLIENYYKSGFEMYHFVFTNSSFRPLTAAVIKKIWGMNHDYYFIILRDLFWTWFIHSYIIRDFIYCIETLKFDGKPELSTVITGYGKCFYGNLRPDVMKFWETPLVLPSSFCAWMKAVNSGSSAWFNLMIMKYDYEIVYKITIIKVWI